MILLIELYFSILRILLLLLGVAVSLTLGEHAYLFVNNLLGSFSLPCIEFISFLVIYTLPGAIIYGAYVGKHFFQRENSYNLKVLVYSFLSGVGLALIPFGNSVVISFQDGTLNQHLITANCIANTFPLTIVGLFASGLLAIVFGFIGMDIGVALKFLSLQVHSRTIRKHLKSGKMKSSRRR